MSVALVTGGAQRLGRAMVLALADGGWDVAVHCNRSRAAAEDVAALVVARGRQAAVIAADLAEPAAASTLVERTQAALGPVSVLINNASIFERDRFGGVSPGFWQRHMDINLLAPVLLSQAFATAAPAEADPVIVNLLDQKVLNLTPDYFSYTVSKAGLAAVTRMLACELAGRVRVNGIAPGLTLPSDGQTDAQFRAYFGRNPLGTGPTLEEICGAMMLFVETPPITGQVIALDGGRHLEPRVGRDDFGASCEGKLP